MEEQQRGLNEATIVDLQKLIQSMLKESERAVVIMAAARLDAELETLLKHLLIPHPGGDDPLFDGDRMLGTFSAKIGMAYRLGAIDNDFEHALQILRKIRNDFAHQLDTESLSTGKQKSRLDILTRWAGKTSMYQGITSIYLLDGKSPEHVQFVCCTVIMAAMLNLGLKVLTPVTLGPPVSISRVLTLKD